MTTIGSTNPYYTSAYSILRKNNSDQSAAGDDDYSSASRQSRSGGSASSSVDGNIGGMTGGDTVFGAKLASALWSIDSQSGINSATSSGSTWLGSQPDTSFETQFLDMSGKSFAEQIRAQYLQANNLTEDALKAMSPQDRQAVEADIRKSVLEAMGINGRQQSAAMAMGAGGQSSSTQTGTGGGTADASGRAKTSGVTL